MDRVTSAVSKDHLLFLLPSPIQTSHTVVKGINNSLSNRKSLHCNNTHPEGNENLLLAYRHPNSLPILNTCKQKEGGKVILHCNPHATGIPTASLLRSLAIPPQQHLRSRHKTCEWKAQQAPLQEMQQHTAVPQRWLLPPSRGAPLHSFITSIPTEFFQETHQPEAYWAASTSYWRTTCCHQGSLKASSLQSHFSFFFFPLLTKANSKLFWAKLRLSGFPSPPISSRTRRNARWQNLLEVSLFKTCLVGSIGEPELQLKKGKTFLSTTYKHMVRKFLLIHTFNGQAISLLCS